MKNNHEKNQELIDYYVGFTVEKLHEALEKEGLYHLSSYIDEDFFNNEGWFNHCYETLKEVIYPTNLYAFSLLERYLQKSAEEAVEFLIEELEEKENENSLL